MSLTGSYQRSVDEKRRVAIPKRLRDGFREGEVRELFLAPGADHSILVYTLKGFTALADRYTGRVGMQDYLRLFYAAAEWVEVDTQGRIRIPDRLAAHAEVGSEVAVLGVFDHIELWAWEVWEKYRASHEPQFDQLAREAWTA